MLVDLLFHRQNVLQFGIVIAGSIGSVVEIRKFHPDTFLYEDLDPTTLEPVERLDRPARLLAAAKLGRTRLIDNLEVGATD